MQKLLPKAVPLAAPCDLDNSPLAAPCDLDNSRDVDEELDGLLSSFSATDLDPLALKEQRVEAAPNVIQAHVIYPVVRPRAFSLPPNIRMFKPSEEQSASPLLSPLYSSSSQFQPLEIKSPQPPVHPPTQPPQPLEPRVQMPVHPPQPLQLPVQPPTQPPQPFQPPTQPSQPLQPPVQPLQPPVQPLQPPVLPLWRPIPPLQPAQQTLSMPQVVTHITQKDYGRVAVALAQFTYYGKVLKRSTITGQEGTDRLDPVVMERLKSDMRALCLELSETVLPVVETQVHQCYCSCLQAFTLQA